MIRAHHVRALLALSLFVAGCGDDASELTPLPPAIPGEIVLSLDDQQDIESQGTVAYVYDGAVHVRANSGLTCEAYIRNEEPSASVTFPQDLAPGTYQLNQAGVGSAVSIASVDGNVVVELFEGELVLTRNDGASVAGSFWGQGRGGAARGEFDLPTCPRPL